MPARKSTLMVAALFALPLLLCSAAMAADDPPNRVGRVSFLTGTVSFHTADQDQWSAASLNYPVIAGNSFWTEPAGRAELEIGPVNLRMDGSTEADVTTLDDHTTEISVPQGHLAVHLAARPDGETYRVLTPRGAVELSQAGDYEIDAGAERQPTRVAVTQGSAALAVAGAPVDLHPGDMAVVTGTDPGDYTIEAAQKIADTEWSRPQLAEAPASSSDLPAPQQAVPQAVPQQQASPLPPTVTGAQDLDRYGRWQQSPQYGQVWYPNQVASDWAPYRDGHWAWVAPWGWTWIDDEPWGFAPFHYGRWASIDGSWAWVPDGISYGGPVYVEPVYAPALVAFVGGAAWGASIGYGSAVGWIPLGPGERFHPGYHVSPRYEERVNYTRFTNVHNTTNIIVNRRGATVVRANDLAGHRPFMGNRLHVSANQLGTAPRAASLNPLVPQQASRMRAAQASTPAPRPHEASLPMHTAGSPVVHAAAAPAGPQRDPHLPNFAAHSGPGHGAPGPAITHSHVAAADAGPSSVPHPTPHVPPMGMTTQAAPHGGAPGPAITHGAHTALNQTSNQAPAIHPVPGPTTIRPQQSPAVNHPATASANPAVASRAFTPTHAPQPHPVAPSTRPANTTIHGDRPFVGQPNRQPSPQNYHPAPVARAAVEPRPVAAPRPQMQSHPVSAPQSHPAPAQHAPPPARHDERDKH